VSRSLQKTQIQWCSCIWCTTEIGPSAPIDIWAEMTKHIRSYQIIEDKTQDYQKCSALYYSRSQTCSPELFLQVSHWTRNQWCRLFLFFCFLNKTASWSVLCVFPLGGCIKDSCLKCVDWMLNSTHALSNPLKTILRHQSQCNTGLKTTHHYNQGSYRSSKTKFPDFPWLFQSITQHFPWPI